MSATMTPTQVEQYRAFRRKGLASIREQHRTAAAARFEDLEFMLSTGETLERALRRLGTTREALVRSARTWGREDVLALIREATA